MKHMGSLAASSIPIVEIVDLTTVEVSDTLEIGKEEICALSSAEETSMVGEGGGIINGGE